MKKKLFCLFLALCGSLLLFAQQEPTDRLDKNGVFFIPEKLPEFPGGMNAMMGFLQKNCRYPEEARKQAVSGRVMVHFMVQEDGSLGDLSVMKPIHPSLDAEALRVVKSMPRWAPGMDGGKAVKVWYTIPVMFRMPKPQHIPPALPRFTIPVGQEVKNTTILGVWQACAVESRAEEYQVILQPVLKCLLPNNTFMNLYTGEGKVSAAIMIQGTYQLLPDNIYVERMLKSVNPVFAKGSDNEISYKFLNDNLVKFSFKLPGQEKKWEEYWFRIPFPVDELKAD